MSSRAPLVTREEDAPPIVRILAASLRRAAAQPGAARRMRRLRGRVALRSTEGPQAATISFADGTVHVTRRVAGDVDVIIATDLEQVERPDTPKPKVTGAARHPLLAVGVANLLDAPRRLGWRAAVDDVWSWAESHEGRPQLLRVVCTDTGGEYVLGQPGGSRIELYGPAWALLVLFSGGDHLGAAVLEDRVRVVADFADLSRFVGVLTAFMFGDEGWR